MYEVTVDNFSELVIEQSKTLPVLVDFWADWCGPCKILMPVLTRLEQFYKGKFVLAKVNTDEQTQLARGYEIQSLPTLKLFVQGQVTEQIHGVQAESVLQNMLNKYIKRDSDKQREQAQQMAAQGDLKGAVGILDTAAASDPDNHRVLHDLATLYMQQGQYHDAENVLKDVSANKQAIPEFKQLNARLKLLRDIEQDTSLAELQTAHQAQPADKQIKQNLALALAGDAQYQAAMNLLLELLPSQDLRTWVQNTMVSIFDIIADQQPDLINTYRGKMFTALH